MSTAKAARAEIRSAKEKSRITNNIAVAVRGAFLKAVEDAAPLAADAVIAEIVEERAHAEEQVEKAVEHANKVAADADARIAAANATNKTFVEAANERTKRAEDAQREAEKARVAAERRADAAEQRADVAEKALTRLRRTIAQQVGAEAV